MRRSLPYLSSFETMAPTVLSSPQWVWAPGCAVPGHALGLRGCPTLCQLRGVSCTLGTSVTWPLKRVQTSYLARPFGGQGTK